MEEKRICLYCKHFYEWRDKEPIDKYGKRYGEGGHCLYDDNEEEKLFKTDFTIVKWNYSCKKFSSIFPQLKEKNNAKSKN